jgi:WD40 repeat protein/mono/diheme cytochrome c family protein
MFSGSMNTPGHHPLTPGPSLKLNLSSRPPSAWHQNKVQAQPRLALLQHSLNKLLHGYGGIKITVLLAAALIGTARAADTGAMQPASLPAKISYYRDIRPILQANCQGCHQPAKAKGGYVMTNFKGLLAGGETEGAAITPEHADQSSILKMVTPQNGEARMPKGKNPLADLEIALITQWIQQGAQDNTPPDAKKHYDADHPPVYSRPPVITSVDFSPDGTLLAVAGFHEVLLYENTNATLVGRLIGLSERVQSLRFSPDGGWLAVAGGDPARLGEIQVWDVAKRKLSVSAPISYDTLYGVSWSSDSKLIAFGCADNTVRAIEASSGKQVVQMGSHSDWVLSTAFSVKGDHIISGGRDMSVKLTEVASQRFIDNITSITPDALKGGVLAVASHPYLEHIVAAGSDGMPRAYRIFREVSREIGDDAQLIADLFPMTGRVFSVRFSVDGKRIACGSGLDRQGQLLLCTYDYTNDVPRSLRQIMGKVPDSRKEEDKQKLEDYKKLGIRELARVAISNSAVYSVAFTPDGNTVAAAGSDGMIRLFSATNGALIKEFVSVPLEKEAIAEVRPAWGTGPVKNSTSVDPESLPEGAQIARLEVQPAQIKFTSRNDYAQLLVTAHLESGDTADVTRLVKFSVKPSLAEVSPTGLITPITNGLGRLVISFAEKSVEAPLAIGGQTKRYHADFVRDVSPIISRLGCNAGTCHGAKEGKNGFKLSLRGYDPETDLRSFTDDLAGRRINFASPDESLMLLKAVAEVPHEGGRRTTVDAKYYQVLRQWIAGGATLDMKSPRVVKIEVLPQDPVVQKLGSRQQMRVVATYADSTSRDVTSEAFIESGNTDVASAGPAGLITTLRRGEAPVLARYEGNYAATTLTVMGDRTGFVWHEPPAWEKIDELVAAKWKRMKIEPSELCTDLEFIRRVYLDLIGLPPTPEEIEAFLKDSRETRVKRGAVIASLIGRPEYVDFWSNKWADLLQCNSKFLGSEGAEIFRAWIRDQVEKNTPYDQFAREILTASGSTHDSPAACYWKILRTPAEAMENTTHLFLATRFNCNKCHDHPFERWTQDQYYHMAAYFAQISFKEDSASEGRKIAGNDVESAKPLFEKVADATKGDVIHIRTGKVAPPDFPYPAAHETKEKATRREQLAAWITTPENRFFASSYANRLWGYLTGVGVIEPLDDIRAGNPPRNPALLEYLTHEFVASGFNTRHLIQLICQSRTYQLSIRPNKWNEDDKVNYSHAVARRLPAETLFDAVFKVTGSTPHISGAKPGELATQLSDPTMDAGSGLLATLGRPARQSACECERSSDIRLGSVMALLSGSTVSSAIDEPTNAIAKLVESEKDDRKLVNDVFLRVINRPATDKETENALALLAAVDTDHTRITNDLAPLETKMVPVIADLTHKREEAIAHAKADLATYDEMTKTLKAELEKRRQAQIDTKQTELKDYEKLLPAEAAFWEAKNNPGDTKTTWVPVEIQELSASGETKLTRENDGSVFANGGKGISDYFVLARSQLTNITGVMLEVLPDDRLPKFGPGRNEEGNFVLSELELSWAPGTNSPTEQVKFAEAKADYSKSDYAVSQAIDGKVYSGRNGWSIEDAPSLQRHVATFKLEDPIVSTNGVTVRFNLQQHFDENHLLGRFRLYFTASDEPLDFGMTEGVVQAAQANAGQRKPEQAAAIFDYYRSIDTEFWRRRQTLAKVSEPLPADPKFSELQKALSKAEEPILLDPHFVQLREDAVTSERQMENKRLIAVQDLTWALINSAGFLFNH